MWNPLADLAAENFGVLLPKKTRVETIDGPEKEWNFVLIHGWHSLYRPLCPLENVLREQFPDARIWRVSYDTHWRSFTQTARDASRLLKAHGVKPEKTILIGYSMGGLVARSMIAQGFDAHALAALATPHRGAAPWLLFGEFGSGSISPLSKRLRNLNRNRRDIARRKDYFFLAFTFTDRTGYCRHDRVVGARSAFGVGIKGVGKRHVEHLTYQGFAPDCGPHLQGMNPEKLGALFEWLEEKLPQKPVE